MIKTIRSKVLILFSAIVVHMYGLIAVTVACMYIWQLFLTEALSAIARVLTERGEALGTNLPPEQRKVIGLKVQEMREDEASWEEIRSEMTEILKEWNIEAPECQDPRAQRFRTGERRCKIWVS